MARASAYLFAIVIAVILVPQPVSAQSPPNLWACALTGTGALSCTIYNGSCTAGPGNGKTCSYIDATAWCHISADGFATCDAQTTSTFCYPDNGVSKCYRSVPAPTFAISPAPLNFNHDVDLYTTSTTKYVTVSNGSTIAAVGISGATVTGDFAIVSNNCPTLLVAQSSCQIGIVATPRMPGTRTGMFTISSSTYGTRQSPLSVNGSGLPPASWDPRNAGYEDLIRALPATPAYMNALASARLSKPSAKPLLVAAQRRPKDDPGDSNGDDPCWDEGPPPPPEPDPNPEKPTPDCDTFESLCDDGAPPPDPDGGGNERGGGGVPGGGDEAGTDTSSDETLFVGDPIHTPTGNKVHVQVDFHARFAAPLDFIRIYNSSGISAAQLAHQNVGVGWRTNWDRSVTLSADGASAQVVRDSGASITFAKSGSSWQAPASVALTLLRQYDQSNTPIGWRLLLPGGQIETYDALGNLATVTTSRGWTYQLSYANNQLTAITNNFGRQISFTYNADGHLATMSNPAGAVTSYTYDSRGRLTAIAFPDQHTRGYVYANSQWPFALTGVVDGLGNAYATFTYDSQGRATGSQFSGGVGGGTIAYPTASSATFTDARNTTRTKNFTTIQGVTVLASETVTCSACPTGASSYTYDASGNLLSFRDKAQKQQQYSYNTRGLPSSVVLGVGLPEQTTAAIAWDSTFNLPASVTVGNVTKTFQYDANGRVVQNAVTVGSTTRATAYTYDARGLVTQINGPRTDVNDVTTYSYDALGNLISITNPLGQTVQFQQFNALGQPQTIVYGNGTVRTRTFDARGRKLTDSYLGTTISLQYDANGQLTRSSSNDGSYTDYLYDGAHRLTGVNASTGENIRYTLDAAGSRTRVDYFDVSNILVKTYRAAYDGLGRRIQSIDAFGRVTTNQYDAAGNMTSTTDPAGRVVTATYDALHRPVLVTDPLSHPSQLTYDSSGRLSQVTDLNMRATSYGYGAPGAAATSITSPDAGVMSNTFDAAGNRIVSQDARGKTTTYQYDALGRLVQTTFADGQGTSLVYDVATNGLGRLARMTDPSGQTTYSYDINGRLSSKTQTTQGISLTLQYAYDAYGRLASLVYPSGKTLSYGYSSGRLTSLSWNGSTLLSGIQYYPFGLPESWMFGGLQEYTRYTDANGRTSGYLTPNGARYLFWNDAGKLDRIVDAQGRVNVAAAANGSVASASSTYSSAYPPSSTINGDRAGLNWANGGGWRDATDTSFPDWLQINFPAAKTIDQVVVYTLQDNYSAPVDPPDTMTFATYGVTDFQIQAWNGASWYNIATVAANSLVKRVVNVAPVTTDRIRVNVTAALSGYSRITEVEAWSVAPKNQYFVYDAAGRISQFNGYTSQAPNESRSYTYDSNGNRLTAVVNGLSYTYGYGAGTNRLTSVTGAYASVTTDAAGNVTSAGSNSYSFDARGRLFQASAVPSGSTVTNYIDGNGQRAAKRVGSGLVGSVWLRDESGHTLGEYSLATGAPVQELVWVGDVPVALAAGLPCGTGCSSYGTAYIWTDHLNTPRYITSINGTSLWEWDSAPFGDSTPNENPSGLGLLTFNHRLPGQYYDVETGVCQNGAREYSAFLGRYLESDPIGIRGGLNTYAYASLSPTTNSDRTGLIYVPVNPCVGLFGALFCSNACRTNGSYEPVLPPDDPDCSRVYNSCYNQCLDIYDSNPNGLPGTGSDRPGRFRRCVRECMTAQGCYNY